MIVGMSSSVRFRDRHGCERQTQARQDAVLTLPSVSGGFASPR